MFIFNLFNRNFDTRYAVVIGLQAVLANMFRSNSFAFMAALLCADTVAKSDTESLIMRILLSKTVVAFLLAYHVDMVDWDTFSLISLLEGNFALLKGLVSLSDDEVEVLTALLRA